MAYSAFTKRQTFNIKPPVQRSKVKSNWAGGIDVLTSIEETPENALPYAVNHRNIHFGSLGNRKGPGYLSDPAGQATDIVHTTITSAADQTITTTAYQASYFLAGASKPITRVDLLLKAATGATGPVIVELRSDSSGPGTVLASSSISAASFTTSYQYLTARFIEAPTLVSGTKYWIVLRAQFNSTGTYYWQSSATYASTGASSTNSGASWGTTNGYALRTYQATSGGVLGGIRIKFSASGNRYDVIAYKEVAGTTAVGYVNEATGAIVPIKTGLSSAATSYRFAFNQDLLVWVNSNDVPYQWNESAATNVSGINAYPQVQVDVVFHKYRLCFLDSTSQFRFSDLGDYTTYQSVSIIYVPSPKPSSPAHSMFQFQDNLWFVSRDPAKAKYVLYGSDLSSFVLRESTANKPVLGPNVLTVDGNSFYFASVDGIYQCNGLTDELISRSVNPIYQAVTSPTIGCMVVWNNLLYYYYPEPGSAVANAALVLDLINGGWARDTNQYISRAFRYNADTDQPLLAQCSSVVGAVYLAEQQYSDLGKPIHFEVWDKAENFGAPGVMKEILFYYLRVAPQTGSYQLDAQVDKNLQNSPISHLFSQQGSGSLWGTAVWGAFTWGEPGYLEETIPVTGRYDWFQNRWVIEGADCPVEIQGYTQYYLVNQPQ